ncbi:hypothetical protein HYU11_04830 [Candidatus Woesearchaeota archaeon]|nr:hypothetical protein [Candidatus Woesearchaeota archaeon]
MEITPIAADSMGTRSCAMYVRTSDCRILIDPSSALGPIRYGLSPHALEFRKLEEDWELIRQYARKSDILAVTHYHYDHHNPDEPGIFKDKTAFLKHPKENINKSQTQRAKHFIENLGTIPKEIIFSDGKKHEIGGTLIEFSEAVFHGTNSRLGFVTEIAISEGSERFLYTSDVEGPSVDSQADFIMNQKPGIIYIDGPMTYMLGYRFSHESLNQSIGNILKIIEKINPETIILDHHLLRDLKYRDRIQPLQNKGTRIVTAAEYAGKEVNQLEAKRKELWKQHPDMEAPKLELRSD